MVLAHNYTKQNQNCRLPTGPCFTVQNKPPPGSRSKGQFYLHVQLTLALDASEASVLRPRAEAFRIPCSAT